MGRWINRDPIGEAGGLNLYAYVGGNPVRYTDRQGLIGDDYLNRPLTNQLRPVDKNFLEVNLFPMTTAPRNVPVAAAHSDSGGALYQGTGWYPWGGSVNIEDAKQVDPMMQGAPMGVVSACGSGKSTLPGQPSAAAATTAKCYGLIACRAHSGCIGGCIYRG